MSNESRKAFEIWFATQYATANFSRHTHDENDYEEAYESVAWFAWQQIAELRAEAERLTAFPTKEELQAQCRRLTQELNETQSLLKVMAEQLAELQAEERQVLALKSRDDVMQQLCDIKSLGVWRVQRWEVPSNELVPNDEMARYVTVAPEELFNQLLQSKQEAKL